MAASIFGDSTQVSTLKVAGANVTAYGKNYLINGGFDRWDYATSQTLDGYGSANRWFLYKDSGTLSLTRYASNTSFFKSKYYATFNAVAAVGAVAMQKVEGLKNFAGKIVTLSYMRALESGTQTTPIPVIYLNFGTGGTPTSRFGATLLSSNIVTGGLCTATYQIPALNTYTFGTTDTSDHLEVIFNMSGTHVTSIGLVQLEEGSVATPWTPYNGEFGGEVQACGRYLPIGDFYYTGQAYSATLAGVVFTFKDKARVAPTGVLSSGTFLFTTAGGGTTSAVSPVLSSPSSTSSAVNFTTSGLTAGYATILLGASGSILFTGCEL